MKTGQFLNRYVPESVNDFFTEVAELTNFSGRFFAELFKPPYEHKEFIRQSFLVGYKTLPLVGLTGFIMGLVLTLQSRPVMVDFGAESMLPQMVTISIIREIGPVITGLICAGKIGSSIGAELGSMRVTEQIASMEVSGTRPMNFIVASRVLATTLMVPILVIYADAIAIYGSFVGYNLNTDTSLGFFLMEAFDSVEWTDVVPATIKTFFFGFAIGIIGTFKGYYSGKGTEGVGRAANNAVVSSSLLIFIIDLIAVQITNLLI